MSRLYGRLSSDRRKTDATVGANYRITVNLTWGSANNPKPLLHAYVYWRKDTDYPSVCIQLPTNVEVEAFRGDVLAITASPD